MPQQCDAELAAEQSASGLMPRYLLDDAARVEGDAVIITGAQASRLRRVLRVRRGDPLALLHPAADQCYQAVVERVGREAVRCRIIDRRPRRPLPPPRIILAAALLRPQRYDFLIEKATELGAAAIRPVWSERTRSRAAAGEAQLSQPSRRSRWRRLALEAAEQSRREYPPEIDPPVALSDLLAEPIPPRALRLIASPAEPEQRIADVFQQQPAPDAVHLLIGPEGGFTAAESSQAHSNGWQPVSLGNRPLRAETAALVALTHTLEAARS